MVGHSFQNYNRVYTGFSVVYTFLHALHMGFKLIIRPFKSRKNEFLKSHIFAAICVNSNVGIGEMNAQICAGNNGQYTIPRHVDSVKGPNSLWHIDGLHCLISYRCNILHDCFNRVLDFQVGQQTVQHLHLSYQRFKSPHILSIRSGTSVQ